MNRSFLFWLLAFVITFFTAYYQRTTGPTYPLHGDQIVQEKVITYEFLRTHGGEGDQIVTLKADSLLEVSLYWKRFKTSEDFRQIKMKYSGGEHYAYLPHQPPAGKLEYFVVINSQTGRIKLPPDENVVIRFKGDVPLFVLIPHVIAMFGAMLLSTRTGLEFFNREPKIKKLTYWTIGFLFVGGFILGPIVQQYAFGAFWTGFPFGHDLTDNKTLFAMIGWLIALFMYKRSPKPEKWALSAAVLLIIIYMIPHSLMGSELDYSKINQINQIEKAE